ncbi:type II toxin-antitoxin system RelE/ParE family toxin [Helicobacter pylori]
MAPSRNQRLTVPPTIMIRSLSDKTTAAIYCGQSVHTLPAHIQADALRKLAILDAASSLPDMVAPPANRLEPVLGKRRGHWRVRIQGPWHLCFRFINGEAWDVGIAECEE